MRKVLFALLALSLIATLAYATPTPWSGRKFITAGDSTITVSNNSSTGGVNIVASPSNVVGTNIIKRNCTIVVGADNGVTLVNADLGPQGKQCFIAAAATVNEITVAADAGTPNVIVRRITAGGSTANLTSSALATAAAGGVACSNTGGTTGIDGATTCSATLQNTSLSAGVWLELISGTAGGTAKRMSISITYTTTI